MSISKVKSVFENVTVCDAWSLQLLQIKNSKRKGTTYCGREITLFPEGTLTNFLIEISEKYCSTDKGLEKMYESVTNYDGSTNDKTIYKLNAESELISDEYSNFITAIGKPDAEVDPLKFSANAYVIIGKMILGDDELSVKLISMQNPITTLKHKYLCSKGTFQEISDKVISLRTTIDVVVINENVYMLTLAGEKLFNMERAYKAICKRQITNIVDADIINDAEMFNSIASCGHNPRKFISFNESHLQKLKAISSRRKISKKFSIPLDGDKFDMKYPGTADKLVKLLCDRGMVDPFDDLPMEVSSSKKWE